MINTTVILAIKIVITIYLSNYLTGSSCSAAQAAAKDAWNDEFNSNYSKYCNCNSGTGTVRVSCLAPGCGTSGVKSCEVNLTNGTTLGMGANTLSPGSYTIRTSYATCNIDGAQKFSATPNSRTFTVTAGQTTYVTLTPDGDV